MFQKLKENIFSERIFFKVVIFSKKPIILTYLSHLYLIKALKFVKPQKVSCRPGIGRSKRNVFLCALKNIFKDNFFEQKKFRR